MNFPPYQNYFLPPSNFTIYPNSLLCFKPYIQSPSNSQPYGKNDYLTTLIQYREFLQAHIFSFYQAQQNLSYHFPIPKCTIQEEIKSPGSTTGDLKGTFMLDKVEESLYKLESGSESQYSLKIEENKEEQSSDPLRTSVIQMLLFFLNEFGKNNQEAMIVQQRAKYNNDDVLLSLFNALVERYTSASKCREDMIRFVLRKALSYLRDDLKNKFNLTSKAASLAFCQRYFNNKFDEMTKCEVDIDNEKEVLDFLLPYKKDSRNRTANNRFITEIFASDIFYADYLKYLDNFDEIMNADNQKKVQKFLDFLLDCVKENAMHKVKRFKRLPWLKVWLETSKVIAYELLNTDILKGFHKKQKWIPQKKQNIENNSNIEKND